MKKYLHIHVVYHTTTINVPYACCTTQTFVATKFGILLTLVTHVTQVTQATLVTQIAMLFDIMSIYVAFAILLAVIDIDLMCGSRNLIETILHPTAFCTISGKATLVTL